MVRERQSLIDLALQTLGATEGVTELMTSNHLGLTSTLRPGQELNYGASAIIDSNVISRFAAQGITPALLPEEYSNMTYPSPAIALGNDALFRVHISLKGHQVSIYDDGQTVQRASSPETIDMSKAQNIKVTLRHTISLREVVAHSRVSEQYLLVEFGAVYQSLGDWLAIIEFDMPDTEQTDGLRHHTIATPICYVEDASKIVKRRDVYEVEAYAWAAVKGQDGDPKTLLPDIYGYLDDKLPSLTKHITAASLGADVLKGLQIGGRNLARNSLINKKAKSYNVVYNQRITEPWEAGQTYTITIYGGTSSAIGIDFYPNNGSGGKRILRCAKPQLIDGLYWGYYTITTTLDAKHITPEANNVYGIWISSEQPHDYTYDIKWIKIERGVASTDYSAAPEFIEEQQRARELILVHQLTDMLWSGHNAAITTLKQHARVSSIAKSELTQALATTQPAYNQLNILITGIATSGLATSEHETSYMSGLAALKTQIQTTLVPAIERARLSIS